MSHDPGMELMSHEWQSGNDGRVGVMDALARIGHGEFPELDAHTKCDLLVGRYSYPIVEVGCPPSHPARQLSTPCRHNTPYWVESQWLRLLWSSHVEMAPGSPALPVLAKAVERFQHTCWTHQRMERLAPLLDW